MAPSWEPFPFLGRVCHCLRENLKSNNLSKAEGEAPGGRSAAEGEPCRSAWMRACEGGAAETKREDEMEKRT